jgi:hypothetical protein
MAFGFVLRLRLRSAQPAASAVDISSVKYAEGSVYDESCAGSPAIDTLRALGRG